MGDPDGALDDIVGYLIVAYTITPARPGAIPINPFYPSSSSSSSSQAQSQGQPQIGEPSGSVPFPEYDPRWASGSDSERRAGAGAGALGLRQMGRLHLVVDDSNVHGLVGAFPHLHTAAHTSFLPS
jgi:hypothetical protein